MKKLSCIVLIFSLVLTLCPTAMAAHVSTDEAAGTLVALGLLRGSDSGLELQRAPTRNETLVMLLRLLGLEDNARDYSGASGFSDVKGTWSEPYVAYAKANGLANGISDSFFGGDSFASVRDYLTFILRALGYSDGADFTWENSITFSDSVGLTNGEYSVSSDFTREDMALISYTALTLKLNGSDTALIEQLYSSGAVTYSSIVATRLAGHLNFDKPVYSASEIYERSSSAVFTLKLYETLEDYEKGIESATASGFFVTSDGAAVMSYHALDGMRYATVTTTDGHVYELTGILYYDALRDIAVVRISSTDIEGVSVTRFPYIDTGDSSAISNGDTVYAISSPNGLSDTISSGIISNKNRIVDDPLYPCLQITAPISSGSSGGVLLNDHGEAIGVIYAMYATGNSLNLCVPINCISDVSFSGEGERLSNVCDRMDTLKEAATITASEYDLQMKVGETKQLVISSDCPVAFEARYTLSETGVVSCSWGDFTSKTSVILNVTAEEAGKCEISIAFTGDCGPEDYESVINVTVTE